MSGYMYIEYKICIPKSSFCIYRQNGLRNIFSFTCSYSFLTMTTVSTISQNVSMIQFNVKNEIPVLFTLEDVSRDWQLPKIYYFQYKLLLFQLQQKLKERRDARKEAKNMREEMDRENTLDVYDDRGSRAPSQRSSNDTPLVSIN